MRRVIFISGILGILLIIISLLGTISDFSNNRLILISGLAWILAVFIPLMIVEKFKYNKKINHIIKSYKNKTPDTIDKPSNKSKFKGWTMNNSHFRERKSGLNWGSGNIRGANAVRGKRRSFLK